MHWAQQAAHHPDNHQAETGSDEGEASQLGSDHNSHTVDESGSGVGDHANDHGEADHPVESDAKHRGHGDSHEHHEPVPNIVTVVLASYRGFDTLGETSVIFTAGIAVMLLLRGRRGEGDGS